MLGRFQPGIDGALGSAIVEDEDGNTSHMFSPEVEATLRDLADDDGIVALDPAHPEHLAGKVETALDLMLGESGTRDVVAEVGGDLQKFLERDFFTKWHLKWYRKRPTYWLLQSPKKSFGLYLFHERITPDTLFLVQRRYVDPKIAGLGHRITELRQQRDAAEGREQRRLQKELDAAIAEQEDVAEFGRRLKRDYRPRLRARSRRRRHPEHGAAVGGHPILVERAGEVLERAAKRRLRLVAHRDALLARARQGQMRHRQVVRHRP